MHITNVEGKCIITEREELNGHFNLLGDTLLPFFFFCRPGGILVCKLEGASFWEKTPGADFVPHCLTLPEGT